VSCHVLAGCKCRGLVRTGRLQVPQQYPPDVREVLIKARNTSLHYDYSQPDYEQLKERRRKFWTTFA
jgi:hypothetical protein